MMTYEDESIPTHKRAALWVFDRLMQDGVNVYTPLLNLEGVDAVIRCEDGTYRDLHIRASAGESSPLWFQVSRLRPREKLYLACVSWVGEPVDCWILPSEEYARHATVRGSSHDLDLESEAPGGGKLKDVLGRYRNAWDLLTSGAVRPYR